MNHSVDFSVLVVVVPYILTSSTTISPTPAKAELDEPERYRVYRVPEPSLPYAIQLPQSL